MTLRLKHSFYRDLCDHYLYHQEEGHDDDEGNHKDGGNNDSKDKDDNDDNDSGDEDDTLARMVMITPQGSHALRNVFITVLAISSLQ